MRIDTVLPKALFQSGSRKSWDFGPVMDHCEISAATFHKLAQLYRDKYMDLSLYDASYGEFLEQLVAGPARVLDVACGPGNVARYLLAKRPELQLLGIDLAPAMVELARIAVPSGRFEIHDCRRLTELNKRYDGILCAFGLPYLSGEEASQFLADAFGILEPRGVLYLSLMEGGSGNSGCQTSSSRDQVFIHYHDGAWLCEKLESLSFKIRKTIRLSSPANASQPTNDLILIAVKEDA